MLHGLEGSEVLAFIPLRNASLVGSQSPCRRFVKLLRASTTLCTRSMVFPSTTLPFSSNGDGLLKIWTNSSGLLMKCRSRKTPTCNKTGKSLIPFACRLVLYPVVVTSFFLSYLIPSATSRKTILKPHPSSSRCKMCSTTSVMCGDLCWRDEKEPVSRSGMVKSEAKSREVDLLIDWSLPRCDPVTEERHESLQRVWDKYQSSRRKIFIRPT
jgi:hypothetical protein